jgi:hypothetical protein
MKRSCVTCLEIDQDLLHEFALPLGPVQVDLEELIRITFVKRMPLKLVDRRIQVPGRRMEKFVPLVWKPRGRNQAHSDVRKKRQCLIEIQKSSVEGESKERGLKGESKAAMQLGVRHPIRGERVPEAVEEGVEMEFFAHLWDSLA